MEKEIALDTLDFQIELKGELNKYEVYWEIIKQVIQNIRRWKGENKLPLNFPLEHYEIDSDWDEMIETFKSEDTRYRLCSTAKIKQFILKNGDKIIYDYTWDNYENHVKRYEERKKKK